MHDAVHYTWCMMQYTTLRAPAPCGYLRTHMNGWNSPRTDSRGVYVCIRIYTYTPYAMSHVTHLNELCHTSEWVMSYIWTSHVTHLNESCCTLEWVTSHTKRRGHDVAACVRVTHMNESCHTYKWSMPHIWMSHTTHISESCHKYEWVTCHPKKKGYDVAACVHDTHTIESCHKHEWVMSRTKRRGHDVAAGVELVQ